MSKSKRLRLRQWNVRDVIKDFKSTAAKKRHEQDLRLKQANIVLRRRYNSQGIQLPPKVQERMDNFVQ